MADVAETTIEGVASEESTSFQSVTFGGSPKNLVVGLFMLLSSMLAFSMGMTSTFFAEATAWTFVSWGALILFMNLLDLYQSYELNADKLIIRNPVRFWTPYREWEWDNIYRMDVLVGKRNRRLEDAVMHIYHELDGEIVKQREDRSFDPKLAQMVIELAQLQAVEDENPKDMNALPLHQNAIYHWSKDGSIA
ncbi:hypothetical protein KFU94_60140 [Chloroflexi bacterium TSY]|nr:hypothetical protein [Chloroflexi bacterium TSY]